MERMLKERMLEESRYPGHLKEELWARIEARLDTDAAPRRAGRQRRRRNQMMRAVKIATGIAAVFAAVAVYLSLPAGTAFMEDLQDWFAPEKKVEVTVEGEKEQTRQLLHQGGDTGGSAEPDGGDTKPALSRYVIYYDQERYKLVQQEGKDVITTKEPLPDRYPEVSLTIEQDPDTKPEDLIAGLEKEIKGKYAKTDAVEHVAEPVAGYRLHALNGQEWNSEVTTVYVVDNGKQGSFVLTMKYFLEAAEGHGARFEQMLKEFKVLSE
jgi:hypothetical protein